MGCTGKEIYGCFGPKGEYYAFFGIELRHLGPAIVVSVFIGILVYIILSILKKTAVLRLRTLTSLIIAIVAMIASLYILVYFFQFGQVQY